MPSWEQIVCARLGRLGIAREREAEIVAEIAAHLEDAAEDALRAGATESDAVRGALALVPSWERLSRELKKEAGMTQRMKTLWIPGATMAVLAMSALLLLSRAGVQPRIVWLGGYGGQAVHFYLPWLLLLPVVGAIGAFWSRCVGGRRLDSLLVAVLPAAACAAFLLALLPLSFVLDAPVPVGVKLSGFAAFLLGWSVAPAAALFAGAAPFVLGRSQVRQQRSQPA